MHKPQINFWIGLIILFFTSAFLCQLTSVAYIYAEDENYAINPDYNETEFNISVPYGGDNPTPVNNAPGMGDLRVLEGNIYSPPPPNYVVDWNNPAAVESWNTANPYNTYTPPVTTYTSPATDYTANTPAYNYDNFHNYELELGDPALYENNYLAANNINIDLGSARLGTDYYKPNKPNTILLDRQAGYSVNLDLIDNTVIWGTAGTTFTEAPFDPNETLRTVPIGGIPIGNNVVLDPFNGKFYARSDSDLLFYRITKEDIINAFSNRDVAP